MSTYKKREEFALSEEGNWSRQALINMVEDDAFVTKSTFSPDALRFPDNSIPFVTTHMDYLTKHPDVNPHHYISNLRLMSRKIGA